MRAMNTVFFRPLGSRNTSIVLIGSFGAIETLAMQPCRAAEKLNSVGFPRGATTLT